jgi:hypothetical protein
MPNFKKMGGDQWFLRITLGSMHNYICRYILKFVYLHAILMYIYITYANTIPKPFLLT